MKISFPNATALVEWAGTLGERAWDREPRKDMLRVYMETTIPSYLTAKPSRDLIFTAHQQITAEWWELRRTRADLYVSQYVLQEAAAGDAEAAERRMELLEGIPVLQTTEPVERLAVALLDKDLFPEKAIRDAYHVASATAHGMDVLLTWNCAHLANAERLARIAKAVRASGHEIPMVCTPEELLGE